MSMSERKPRFRNSFIENLSEDRYRMREDEAEISKRIVALENTVARLIKQLSNMGVLDIDTKEFIEKPALVEKGSMAAKERMDKLRKARIEKDKKK